ncbi:MAG: PQQ-dependent sugar dehydrogenase [Cyclobacteriaceae bacterium]
MSRFFTLGVIILMTGCTPTTMETDVPDESLFPEENRFVQEVLAKQLYEPTEMEVMPDGRVLFVERRGGINLYDPKTEKLTLIDSLPVFYAMEDGLMGLALDPDFKFNNWIYLYYSHPGKEAKQHLSRFDFSLSGLKNEKVMLVVPTQREECCHTGSSIQFGPDGLLYLSTGDDTNPFDSNGYGPMDEREGRSPWDARGTASNTNDLRGKILRIDPQPDGTYTIPEGNLYEDDDPLTRPEIFVMGCRNPYRISVDQKRNWLVWGDVGPDAGKDSELRGPRGHDEMNIAKTAGYYGWPMFVADNKAYRKYDFATGKASDYFDPEKPINNSINNTGITNLPAARPAYIFYPYATSTEFPQFGSGGRNAMVGPVYYSDFYEGSRFRFPKYFDGRLFVYDWIRGWIFSVDITGDQPRDFQRIMPNSKFNFIIDMEMGPDGTLYLLEYGTGWFTRNIDSQLSKINFYKGNRPPVLNSTVSSQNGAAPLEVVFDAANSTDPDQDNLTFLWEIDGLKFKDSKVNYTFDKEGIYYPRITIRDKNGYIKTEQYTIEVGNEAPQIDIAVLGNTKYHYPGRVVNYEVKVTDREDAITGLDSTAIEFKIRRLEGYDEAEVLGHQSADVKGLEVMESSDCKSCHKLNEMSIGPSYTMVAQRYSASTKNRSYLINKIIAGGGGVWGEHAMSAHPDLSQSDASKIVDYIFSLVEENDPLRGELVINREDKEKRILLQASYRDKGAGIMKSIEVQNELGLVPAKLIAVNNDRSNNVEIRKFIGQEDRVNNIYHKSWIAFEGVDMTDVVGLKLRTGGPGSDVSVRKGSEDGPEIARLNTRPTSSGSIYFESKIASLEGEHDLYFIFLDKTEDTSFGAIYDIELLF